MNCMFCNCELNVVDVHISIPNATNAYIKTYVCQFCQSFNPHSVDNENRASNSQHQAMFHEALFCINDANSDQYLADAQGIRRIISVDYKEYFGNQTEEFVCEVGAGRGNLLKALQDEGYKAIGCEFSKKLVDTGRSIYDLNNEVFINLDAWNFANYLQHNGIKPTVLIFWHVIEHIQDSLRLIETLKHACSTELTIIIQTPLLVPEYIFPEHLFFPSTETYHFLANRLGLAVRLLNVIPYTRYLTCILSNKNVSQGNVVPSQLGTENFSALGQLVAQLGEGLINLDQVTKHQYQVIKDNRAFSSQQISRLVMFPLASELENIAELLSQTLKARDNTISHQRQEIQQMQAKQRKLQEEIIRAEEQLNILKDVLYCDHLDKL